jgi:hypothetical protein
MKFTEAKNYLESQKIRIGIGFYFTGKKMEDFGPVFKKSPDDFSSDEEYEKARLAVEGKTEELYNAAKKAEDGKIEIIFRQPTLDEMIAISGEEKKLPIDLNLNVPEIARIALDWMGQSSYTTMEKINNSISVLEKCYLDNTFEDKPSAKEVMEFIKSSKDLSMDVVQKFFAKVGK